MDIELLRDRAYNKINREIKNETLEMIDLAKICGAGELFYFVHYLHFIRIFHHIEFTEGKNEINSGQLNQINDIYRYLIQLIRKHFINKIIGDSKTGSIINYALTDRLVKLVQSIISKHEAISFIQLSPDFELHGERDQFIKINFQSLIDDPSINKFFFYFLRLEVDNQNKLNLYFTKDNLIKSFIEEYTPHKDLFEKSFSISLNDYIEFIEWTIDTVIENFKTAEKEFPLLQNGKINTDRQSSIILYASTLFINKNEIIERFNEDFLKKINFFIFKESSFDEYEIKYDLISRNPIIKLSDEIFMCSPELILDSVYINTHYSILETGIVKNEYIKRYSENFLDKITKVAAKYGFSEVDRELDLFEGKNKIGDIDLILANQAGLYLLVEAKSHSLPLNVYSKDLHATMNRLNYLQKDWEKKVNRRIKYLEINRDKHNIPDSNIYLIVSKQPEILSHFSNILVLSLEEFEYWLTSNDITISFETIFDRLYRNNGDLSSDQLEAYRASMYPSMKFIKEI